MAFEKPWKSYQEQLDILKSRNIRVENDSKALSYLMQIGYYRLSAYWHPFRIFKLEVVEGRGLIGVKKDEFIENTLFEDAVNLYFFDKKLRLIVVDALEGVEIALRGSIAYVLGEKAPFAHLDPSNFHPKFAAKINKSTGNSAFEDWQKKYENLIHRSKEDFVKHFRQSYGGNLPIWVAIEVWDFGALSQLYSMMRVPDQIVIAQKYGVSDFRVFSSWLRSLNYLRNLVAHHSRLWNRNIIDQPKLPKCGEISWCDSFIDKPDLISKPFLLLSILRHLTLTICPDTRWHDRLSQHLLFEFPALQSICKVSIDDIGVPDKWEQWWVLSA